MTFPMLCTPKRLPLDDETQQGAADHAVEINPVNAPRPMVALPPQRIALLTSRYWGAAQRRLGVAFLERAGMDLRGRILHHMNAWADGGAGIQFAYAPSQPDVRITFMDDGYWSYLGTDVHQIPRGEPTMCLQGFTMSTSEAEYRRVVRHETGHTLGFVHEHMRKELVARIDPDRAYVYFERTQHWDAETVDQQVLTPLSARSIMATPPDETSVMCYQLPGSIMKDGKPIIGGHDINESDQSFANRVYPKLRSA